MLKFVIGFISGLMSFFISGQLIHRLERGGLLVDAILHSLLIGLGFAVASTINGHNQKMLIKSKTDFLVNIMVSAVIGSLLAWFLLYITKFTLLGRWMFILSCLFYVALTFGMASLLVRMQSNIVYRIIGDRVDVFREVAEILGNPSVVNQYKFVQCRLDSNVALNLCSSGEDLSNNFLVPGEDEFLKLCGNRSELISKIGSRIFSIEQVIEKELCVVYLSSIWEQPWWTISTALRFEPMKQLKRLVDILLACVGATLGIPIIFIAALMIKISDGGSVFYCQTRLGQFGKKFTIYKLRSMKIDSEKNGVQWAKVGDARVTPIGVLLRKTRIDELPQLWNVLRGEMSLVGPRPERPEFYNLLENDLPGFSLRLVCKPGLTGWAQVNYPYGASLLDSRIKLMHDLYYIKNASLMLDCRIITRTLVAMVKGAR